MKERYNASLVCRNCGWHHVVDHMRIIICLNNVGKHIRSLIFEPMMNSHNFYDFMNMIFRYYKIQELYTEPLEHKTHIHKLKLTSPRDRIYKNNSDVMTLYGTGIKFFETVIKLIGCFCNMKCLELIDFMMNSEEAIHIMDKICKCNRQTLSKLILINATRCPCPITHFAVFKNLHTLVISPQNLSETVLAELGCIRLRHLHILQNHYSIKELSLNLPNNVSWKKLKQNNPKLKIHLEIESRKKSDVILNINEHEIPFHSIVLDNPNTQVLWTTILNHAMNFGRTLHVYALKGLTVHYLEKVFAKRIDETIVKFCKLCPNLHTLMIRYKLSTATLLEIVSTAKSLRFLYVRRNVILKKFDADWLSVSDWSPEHCKWIKENCKTYEKTEQEISRILGYRWRMLSEKEFAKQTIRLYV
ncbi:PREDICTED: uncharacterized protein LOC105360257 [Ceratosolen solmsi marchali]|uniref:Uncharacterized protein LOC105360257 n=1 Tax=Ceratosolen solmsi marchali TaxID=326594 RepID=A0AAJ6VMY0_9HYME|nr:PREDICTED: uncharacterized protein LOC105360257 [Ceratosolen solmsi marchali]